MSLPPTYSYLFLSFLSLQFYEGIEFKAKLLIIYYYQGQLILHNEFGSSSKFTIKKCFQPGASQTDDRELSPNLGKLFLK